MQTLEPPPLLRTQAERRKARPTFSWSPLLLALAAAVWVISGCHKDPAAEASDSDANGYLCLKCGAKFYTARAVFIGPECPKCHERALADVVGYACPKDNHLTMVARDSGRGTPVCETCQGPLTGMRLPREKDFKAWGATKVSSDRKSVV